MLPRERRKGERGMEVKGKKRWRGDTRGKECANKGNMMTCRQLHGPRFCVRTRQLGKAIWTGSKVIHNRKAFVKTKQKKRESKVIVTFKLLSLNNGNWNRLLLPARISRVSNEYFPNCESFRKAILFQINAPNRKQFLAFINVHSICVAFTCINTWLAKESAPLGIERDSSSAISMLPAAPGLFILLMDAQPFKYAKRTRHKILVYCREHFSQ